MLNVAVWDAIFGHRPRTSTKTPPSSRLKRLSPAPPRLPPVPHPVGHPSTTVNAATRQDGGGVSLRGRHAHISPPSPLISTMRVSPSPRCLSSLHYITAVIVECGKCHEGPCRGRPDPLIFLHIFARRQLSLPTHSNTTGSPWPAPIDVHDVYR